MKKEKIPLRRCVGCRQSSPKTELLRFFLGEGAIVWDEGGKNGRRGAYLHRREICVARAMKDTKGWDYAFRLRKGAVVKQMLETLRMSISTVKYHESEAN